MYLKLDQVKINDFSGAFVNGFSFTLKKKIKVDINIADAYTNQRKSMAIKFPTCCFISKKRKKRYPVKPANAPVTANNVDLVT